MIESSYISPVFIRALGRISGNGGSGLENWGGVVE